jgi:hypothetical protein
MPLSRFGVLKDIASAARREVDEDTPTTKSTWWLRTRSIRITVLP